MTETPPQPTNGKALRLLDWARNLTLGQVLILALLAAIFVPVFIIYKAVSGDEHLLNRLMSQYEERPDQSGCLVRHVRERGGPDQYGISSGFAVMGVDRWFITVIIPHPPKSDEEVTSYCESAKLLADQLLGHTDRDGPPD